MARKYIDRLIGVDEGWISGTILDLYSKLGIVVEPAGAATIAALEVVKDQIKGKPFVVSFLVVITTSTGCRKWRNVRLSTRELNTTLLLIFHNVQGSS